MASATAGAASEIARASQSLAQGANEQGASLQELSSSGEQISHMTTKNADHSRDAADKMSLAARRIDEIAFQTNMMALTN